MAQAHQEEVHDPTHRPTDPAPVDIRRVRLRAHLPAPAHTSRDTTDRPPAGPRGEHLAHAAGLASASGTASTSSPGPTAWPTDWTRRAAGSGSRRSRPATPGRPGHRHRRQAAGRRLPARRARWPGRRARLIGESKRVAGVPVSRRVGEAPRAVPARLGTAARAFRRCRRPVHWHWRASGACRPGLPQRQRRGGAGHVRRRVGPGTWGEGRGLGRSGLVGRWPVDELGLWMNDALGGVNRIACSPDCAG